MKSTLQIGAVMLLTILNSRFATCSGQGSLTPPGAPAPTMLTLSQVEPRTPISSAPFIITQPGSYYLTTNISVSSGNAITIAINGVTLDLGGFTISSSNPIATGTGILLNSGLQNIIIANGIIQGGITNNGSGIYTGRGFANGINYSGNPPANVQVSRLSISGCQNYGIYLYSGNSTVVESCTVRTAGNYGIYASTVKQSTAIDCGATAIYGDQVSDCQGQSSGSGNGVQANIALNCYGTSSSGAGISAASTAMNCTGGSYGNGTGVFAFTAENCYGTSGSFVGINADNALNCYGSTGGSGTGIAASIAQNCFGTSASGSGVSVNTAQNCYGSSTGGSGVYAYYNVENCYGYNGAGGYGIYCGFTASGCYGYCSSGTGVSAFIANVCHGASSTGTGLSTTHNVNSF